MQHRSGLPDDGDAMSDSIRRNTAEVLDWFARHRRGEFVSFQELAEFVFDKEDLYWVDSKGEDAAVKRRRDREDPVWGEFERRGRKR
jgi:hypothetical protein